MILTVGNIKGGVGKTMTAIHLATFLNRQEPTLLVDSDGQRGCVKWCSRGGMPFTVVDEKGQAKAMREKAYAHIVFDTEGNIDPAALRELAVGCDLLVIPAVPEASATDGLLSSLEALKPVSGKAKYRVFLNKVRHNRRKQADDLRAALVGMGVSVFKAEIPDFVAFDKASGEGCPVYEVKDENAARAWEAIEALGKEIKHG